MSINTISLINLFQNVNKLDFDNNTYVHKQKELTLILYYINLGTSSNVYCQNQQKEKSLNKIKYFKNILVQL